MIAATTRSVCIRTTGHRELPIAAASSVSNGGPNSMAAGVIIWSSPSARWWKQDLFWSLYYGMKQQNIRGIGLMPLYVIVSLPHCHLIQRSWIVPIPPVLIG
jgi:hypothetical protein